VIPISHSATPRNAQTLKAGGILCQHCTSSWHCRCSVHLKLELNPFAVSLGALQGDRAPAHWSVGSQRRPADRHIRDYRTRPGLSARPGRCPKFGRRRGAFEARPSDYRIGGAETQREGNLHFGSDKARNFDMESQFGYNSRMDDKKAPTMS